MIQDDTALMLSVRGMIFREIAIHYGAQGWPHEEASLLRKATREWNSLDEARRIQIKDLLLTGFNRMFPAETAQGAKEWAHVVWSKTHVLPNYIYAESVEGRFVVKFVFYDDFVSVSYSGPVKFSLAVVQQQEPIVFAREEVIRTENAPCTVPVASFWPLNEATDLARIVRMWLVFVLITTPDMWHHVQNELFEGFNRLMRILPAVDQEEHNHALDADPGGRCDGSGCSR
jgi:hypothetical protein